MTARIACAVTGCGRSIGKATALKRWGWEPTEFICPKHWARLTRQERRVHNRHLRQMRRHGFQPRPEAAARVWRALVRRSAA